MNEEKIIIGEKYLDKHDEREYELVGIVEKRVAILIRGASRQEVNVDDFGKFLKRLRAGKTSKKG